MGINLGMGDRIKLLREENNLTQSQLAKMLGLSASTIGMYEQGKRNPEYEILLLLSKTFSVSTDYIIKGEGKPFLSKESFKNYFNSTELVAFENLDKWNEEEKEELIKLLNKVNKENQP